MIYNEAVAGEIAEYLLQIKAIQLSPQKPFTWASGLQSPIYCDNRKTLSYPDIRNKIKEHFAMLIKAKFPRCDKIAGVATAGIAHGALVADALSLPFLYVRSKAKGHGLQNLIEGEVSGDEHIVVVEDLISTGGSSLKAVEALAEAGCTIEGVVAIFSYGFPEADEAFQQRQLPLYTLSGYTSLLDVASKKGYITDTSMETLNSWRKDRHGWAQQV